MRVFTTGISITSILLTGLSSTHAEAFASAPQSLSTQVLELPRSLKQYQAAPRGRENASRIFWGSRDAKAPHFRTSNVEERAVSYLRHYAAGLGLSAQTINGALVNAVHSLRSGAQLVQFSQQVGGVDVYGARLSVLTDASGRLVAITGQLFPNGRVAQAKFRLSHADAVAKALGTTFGRSARASRLRAIGTPSGGYQSFTFNPGPHAKASLVDGARAKQVMFRHNGVLVPAYYAEHISQVSATGSNEGLATIVSASDGAILKQYSITQYDSYKYRVWAEKDGMKTPLDGPLGDSTPLASGSPSADRPDPVDPELVEMEGFNTNPEGTFDPWLFPGASQTKGNNVDAYSDRNQTVIKDANGNNVTINDGYDNDDLRATLTDALTFDRTFDVTKDPGESDDQIMAAATQLFYDNNWLHDYWYDSGFNEISGVAQYFNYGRGGLGNDEIHAEAQDSADGGQANNANMSTPADGANPRMQMYVWDSRDIKREITLTPTVTDFTGESGASLFGPKDFDVTGEIVLANDGTDPATDGCEEPTTPADYDGKIVIVEIGPLDANGASKCRAVARAKIAQDAGAIGLLFIGDTDVAPGLGNDPAAGVTIPGLGLGKSDGDKILAALEDGTVSAHMVRDAGTILDGTIDNQIVAHEWGHYMHHRLIPGCASNSCGGMSEGWGDFLALHMTMREGDDVDGVYGMAGYATEALSEASMYFGIRRYPYSTDMEKNPLTFRHITTGVELPSDIPTNPAGPDNAEVHNAGEVWASLLHEGHVNLLKVDGRDWTESHRRMADYVVAGMKMAPADPGYGEQRDAILAAALAADMSADDDDLTDFTALAEGFAKRGMGSCAISPPAASATNMEAVESFELKGNLQFQDWGVVDAVESCDDDSILDVNEKGGLVLLLANNGSVTLEGTTVSLSTDSTAIKLEKTEYDVEDLKSFGESLALLVEATVTDATTSIEDVVINVTIKNENSCTEEIASPLKFRVNADELPESSMADDFESANSPWTVMQAVPEGAALWGRSGLDPSDRTVNFIWGQNAGTLSDTSIVTPAIQVAASGDFKVNFEHLYQFETGPAVAGGPDVHWDGGVIEYSTDGGSTWTDVSEIADPGYPAEGTIGDDQATDNPLLGRKGFIGMSEGIETLTFQPVEIDFGSELAGKTVHLRFRIGTDSVAGGLGWAIDNFTVEGADNKPFTQLANEDGACDDTSTGTDSTGTGTGTDDTDTDTGTNSDDGTESTGEEDDDSEDGTDSGCGCSTTGETSPLRDIGLSLLALLPFAAIRRRRRN
jgi:MYXO-CTERM domain-containing protein